MASIPAAFQEAFNRVTNAKTQLIEVAPYFASLALSIKYKADPTCKTAYVNGREIGFNPAFIATLTHDQVVTLVAHEVMHPALGHPWREEGRNHRLWNIATDKVINRLLLDADFILPADCYIAEGDEIGKTAEWIYSRMQHEEAEKQAERERQKQEEKEQEQKQDDGGQGSGAGDDEQGDQQQPGNQPGDEPGEPGEQDGDGEPGDGPGDDEEFDSPFGEVRPAPADLDEDGDPAPSEQEWKDTATMAAVIAKGQGTLPGGVERAIKERSQPVIDVKALLLKFMQACAEADYSWAHRNRRYRGVYLPALHSEGMGEVVFMADTSGSMDRVALAMSQGIIAEVIEECRPAAVTVVYADTVVTRVDRFEKDEELEWRARGGGGTSFVPALEYIENEVQDAVCIICLTDMDGTYPDTPPTAPVLWLNLNKYDQTQEAPFGDTVPACGR